VVAQEASPEERSGSRQEELQAAVAYMTANSGSVSQAEECPDAAKRPLRGDIGFQTGFARRPANRLTWLTMAGLICGRTCTPLAIMAGNPVGESTSRRAERTPARWPRYIERQST